MENKNESKKGIIRGISGTLAGILAGIMVGLTPNSQLVSFANQNNTQNEDGKNTENGKESIDRFIDEDLGIGNDISKEDRQLLKEKYEKAIYQYIYYYNAKQKLENENTLNLTDEQIEVAAKAYAYLKSEGVKEEQNIGALAVMLLESGLNPNAISIDEYQFFGVMQWSSNQIEKIQEFADGQNDENGTDYKYTDIEIQMPYWLKGDQNTYNGERIVDTYNKQYFEGGAEAARYLEEKYIRPRYINDKAIENIASAFEKAISEKTTTKSNKGIDR